MTATATAAQGTGLCIHEIEPRFCSFCRARAGYRPGTDRQRKDCAVVAFSALTGAEYDEAVEALATAGRRPGAGTATGTTLAALVAVGFRAEQSGLTPALAVSSSRATGDSYLVVAWERRDRPGHAFAVVGGEVINAGRYLSTARYARVYRVS